MHKKIHVSLFHVLCRLNGAASSKIYFLTKRMRLCDLHMHWQTQFIRNTQNICKIDIFTIRFRIAAVYSEL